MHTLALTPSHILSCVLVGTLYAIVSPYACRYLYLARRPRPRGYYTGNKNTSGSSLDTFSHASVLSSHGGMGTAGPSTRASEPVGGLQCCDFGPPLLNICLCHTAATVL